MNTLYCDSVGAPLFAIRQKYLWLVFGLLLCLMGGCQEATEPETLSLPVTITLRVEDQSGQPIGRTDVLFTRGGNAANLTLAGSTGGDGLLLLRNQPVRLEGEDFLFRFIPPVQFSLDPITVGPLRIPCSDTTLSIRLSREELIRCNSAYSAALDFLLCLDEQDSEELCTPLLTHNCPNPLEFTLGSLLPDALGMTLRAIDETGQELGNVFSRAAGERFQLCLLFQPNAEVEDEGQISFSASDGVGNAISGSIRVTAQSERCDECDCPDSFSVREPEVNERDSVCVGASERFEVPIRLSNFSEEGCDYLIELQEDFSGGDVAILAFNGRNKFNATLAAGGNTGFLSVLYTPSSRGEYRDRAVYSVRARNPEGELLECESTIAVTFIGWGGIPECLMIEDANDTSFVPTTQRLFQCVNQDDNRLAKRIAFINTGECDLDLSLALDDGSVFELNPTELNIEPGQTQEVLVKFLPRDENIWPSGRGAAPPLVEFADVLRINGCEPASFDLTGLADTVCSFVTNLCLHRYGEENDTYTEGVRILEDNQLLFVNQAETSDIDFYVDAIDVGIPEAAIRSESGLLFKVVDSRSLSPNETLCDLRDRYFDECAGGGFSASLPTVNPNDVIIFKRDNFCGAMWISKIDLDRADPGNALAQVCFQICYPL